MYPESEILFPSRCTLHLRDLRGAEWRRLIDHVSRLADPEEDALAFSLMVIRLSSCLTCDLDSYRASLGCCICARRTIAGYKGSDKEMLRLFEKAREEVRAYLASENLPPTVTALIAKPKKNRPKDE